MTVILTLLLVVGLLAVLLLAHTLYRAALRHKHALAAPGIDEAGLVSINGIQQYLQIRGKKPENPVLLVLHGGPGSPLSAMAYSFQYPWEDAYTVVQWDQRQSGKTYFAGDEQAVAGTLNFATVLEDAYQVIQYLRQRFGVQKVAVMGHSWGTVLGTALAQALFEELTAPTKKLYLIPDAGHFTMYDNAPAFNKALLGEIRASLQ